MRNVEVFVCDRKGKETIHESLKRKIARKFFIREEFKACFTS
jgi:hypothetical protein